MLWRSRLLALLGGTLLALGVFAAAVRVVGVDRRLLASALYYQNSHPAMYRPSADPFLHYELRPGRYRADGHVFTVDASGVRGAPRPRVRAPGTLRILAGGGSTTFGFDVSDEQTWPAALERTLQARLRRPVEVWNLGVEAYVLSQVSERLRARLDPLAPDLLVVQLYNLGGRPFIAGGLSPRTLGERALGDDDAVRENFTHWENGPETVSVERFRGSVFARLRLALARRRGNPHASQYGDQISYARAARLFREARARGIEVVYVVIPAAGPATPVFTDRLGVPARNVIDLFRPGLPAGWYDCHPPPAGLVWLGERVADELQSRGFIPS